MGRITKIIQGEKAGLAMYAFSEDLLSGVRFFAFQTEETEESQKRIFYNTSTVFYAGSYLECLLNELVCDVSNSDSKEIKPNVEFWKVLENQKKSLGFKQKWDLICSIYGGKQWDSSIEPFQSYDVIITLRNELVHYKGKYLSKNEIPYRRIESLLQQFKGDKSLIFEALDVSSWVHELLTSKEIGRWVCDVVMEFDLKHREFLTGKKMTEEEIQQNKLLRLFH